MKKILVIDDEPDVLDVIRAVLKTKGHRIVTAAGGEEGLQRVEQEGPDLIVLDLMMPRVSGLEVIKRLKANEAHRRIPIIVVSAIGADDKHPRDFWIKGLGVDDFLEKPFDPLDLVGRVEFIFRRNDYVSHRPPGIDEDTDRNLNTQARVPLEKAEPSEVVAAFVESYNDGDFATEFNCLGEEMTGGLAQHDYVARRRQVYLDDKGSGRSQRIAAVHSEEVSVNIAKVVVDREESASGQSRRRREQYALKKTHRGWKIVNYRPVRGES